jgi:hypothetical protein
MTHALALGCSHTAAVGIDYRLGYVARLAEQFDIQIINLAIPGGNSSTVEKSLVDHLQHSIPEFVIAQWPNPYRRTMWKDGRPHNENASNSGTAFRTLLSADQNNFVMPWLQSIVTCTTLCRFAKIPIINILLEDIDSQYHTILSEYNIQLFCDKKQPGHTWLFDSAASDHLHHSAHCHQQWANRLAEIINEYTSR